MSKSEKSEKPDGVTIVTGGIPAGEGPALPSAKDGGKLRSMTDAAKKLYHTVGAYVGDLAESGRVAAAGFAMKQHAEGVAKLGDAYAKLSKQFGPKKAAKMLGATPETLALRRRAGARMLQMEEQRQQNIDSVVLQAAQKLPEKVSDKPVHPDWTARFIESVKDVSDETAQKMWSSILAGEVETPGKTSLRTLDVLKNMSQQEAQEFERLAQFTLSGGAVYYPVQFDNEVAQRILPYPRKIHMQECGLIHHEINAGTKFSRCKSAFLTIGTFAFGLLPRPPLDIFDLPLPGFSISAAGQEIARHIPARAPEVWYLRAIAKFVESKGVVLRLISPFFPRRVVIDNEKFGLLNPLPGPEFDISPTASDEELQALLKSCPRRVVVK